MNQPVKRSEKGQEATSNPSELCGDGKGSDGQEYHGQDGTRGLQYQQPPSQSIKDELGHIPTRKAQHQTHKEGRHIRP